MTTTPDAPTTPLPRRPPGVDLTTWQFARDELLVREKAHTRDGEALRRGPPPAADGGARRDGRGRRTRWLGPVPGTCSRAGTSSWSTSTCGTTAPRTRGVRGLHHTAWHLKDAVYLNARGVSFAILTTGRWDEVASHVDSMGYTQPWYSVREVDAPVGGSMGYTSPASCATATACSSPTPGRAVATSGSTGPWACST